MQFDDEMVLVKYDPQEPGKKPIAQPLYLWGIGGSCVLLGLIFLVAAIAVV